MAKNNGHWYTDKNGNHYFVENGQSPKEGWEESKRRKMISGGKYMTSEDGNEYSEVDKDKYDAYEADDADFDENVDDDFGFDEEDDIVSELKNNGVDMDSQAEIREYLGATLGWDREDQMEFVKNLGFTPFEEDDQFGDDDGDDFEEEEKVRYLDKTYSRYFDSQENWKRNETGNYEIGDDENYGYVLNDGERPGMIRAGRVRNADHEHPEEEFFEDPQEAKEWVEEVANGEYNREMQSAQEENAAMSEGEDRWWMKEDADVKRIKEIQKAANRLHPTPWSEESGELISEMVKAENSWKTKEDVDAFMDNYKDKLPKPVLDDFRKQAKKEFLLNHASEFNMSENDTEKFLDGSEDEGDDLSDVENGTFTAYGKAGLEEIRDAKRRNYYIEYEKHDSAGDPRYSITIDKTRNYDGSLKNAAQGKGSPNLNKKIEEQVDDGVTEDDIGYLRQVLNETGINQLTNEQIRKIISSIRNRRA